MLLQQSTHIICTGAIYIDTILTIPHFPTEDTKLRAKALSRRRGGNTANTLEVLSQLPSPGTLHIIAVLPDKDSAATQFIAKSLPAVNLLGASIFRPGKEDAASSYILQNETSMSRTIVSVNELEEMSLAEFRESVEGLGCMKEERVRKWFHFEGRIPEVTGECVRCLRGLDVGDGRLGISVECEKPDRVGMGDVAAHADLVVYSRLWAETNGYTNPRTFLEAQIESTRPGALLCCTWGADGATAVKKHDTASTNTAQSDIWATAKSWHPEHPDARPVDTIGAGDTFIAGMLFALINRPEWTLERKLQFSNELAGRKVFQAGFADLGQKMQT